MSDKRDKKRAAIAAHNEKYEKEKNQKIKTPSTDSYSLMTKVAALMAATNTTMPPEIKF